MRMKVIAKLSSLRTFLAAMGIHPHHHATVSAWMIPIRLEHQTQPSVRAPHVRRSHGGQLFSQGKIAADARCASRCFYFRLRQGMEGAGGVGLGIYRKEEERNERERGNATCTKAKT